MTPTIFKNNVIRIVLCIGIILIHNSSGEKVKKNINLYYDLQSPPCRAVLLTLEALNLEFNLIRLRLLLSEQLSDDFRKINSLHTLPVIQDGDFVLSDSHAIIVYLVRKYGGKKDHPLFPNDPKLQAQVNQRLHFDNGTLFPAFTIQYNPWIYFNVSKTDEREEKIHEALVFLENVLKKSPWTAGESMTVADFSLVATITTLKVAGVEMKKYDKINEWLIKCSTSMDGYQKANQEGIDFIIDMIKRLDKKFKRSPPTKSPQYPRIPAHHNLIKVGGAPQHYWAHTNCVPKQVAGVDLKKYDKIFKRFIKCTNTMDGYAVANQEGINELEATLEFVNENVIRPLGFMVIINMLTIKKQKVEKNINLYYDPISPPCRAVLLTLEALNLKFNLIYIHLLDSEQLTENFRKINSLHTVPVIEEGDFVLSDSHAIIVYLVREYGGKDDHPLYPNDPEIQAQVNQRLYFDDGTLYLAFRRQYNPWIYRNIPKTEEGENKIHEALRFLENVLKKSPWAAGESMTVADFSLVASISTFKVAGVDLKKYDNINEWFTKCENKMDGYKEANQAGIDVTDKMLISLNKKSAN
ncbi:uncharacterized protein LOC132952466 [Metopolophium dirhodum]|uniref:uncharacterized protein LOC132952466 n=1 Tax=Metopolophium dirhodum TaxID=44670 RepID=UPI00298F4C29|nr:uncharacterized protein LOC132952466 [Metopolophium dirhodum]